MLCFSIQQRAAQKQYLLLTHLADKSSFLIIWSLIWSPGGAVDSPYPFMSRANTLKPAAATAGIYQRGEEDVQAQKLWEWTFSFVFLLVGECN